MLITDRKRISPKEFLLIPNTQRMVAFAGRVLLQAWKVLATFDDRREEGREDEKIKLHESWQKPGKHKVCPGKSSLLRTGMGHWEKGTQTEGPVRNMSVVWRRTLSARYRSVVIQWEVSESIYARQLPMDMRDGPTVKNTYCSCRGSSSQHTHQVTHNHLTPVSRKSDGLSWPPWAPACIRHVWTHVGKTHTHK